MTVTPTSSVPLPALADALRPEDLVDRSRFTEGELKQAQDLAAAVDVNDTNVTLTFGAGPQRRLSDFLDILLRGVKTEDAGVAGDLAIELANGIDALHLDKLKKELGGWSFSKIPLIGSLFSHARYFWHKKEEFLTQIDRIVRKAEERKTQLMTDNVKLDQLVEETEGHIGELKIHIVAGEMALETAKADFLAQRQAMQAQERPDALAASQLNDYGNQINAFEARLMKVKIFFTESLISVPQIRVSQEAIKIEIQNIMDGLLFDLPRLKHAVIRVAALLNIREAQEENDARREASAKIGQLGADLLDQAYTEAKASQGSALEEVENLADLANKLVSTIQAGAEIEKDNQQKRAAANQKLVEIKGTITEVMRDIAPVES